MSLGESFMLAFGMSEGGQQQNGNVAVTNANNGLNYSYFILKILI